MPHCVSPFLHHKFWTENFSISDRYIWKISRCEELFAIKHSECYGFIISSCQRSLREVKSNCLVNKKLVKLSVCFWEKEKYREKVFNNCPDLCFSRSIRVQTKTNSSILICIQLFYETFNILKHTCAQTSITCTCLVIFLHLFRSGYHCFANNMHWLESVDGAGHNGGGCDLFLHGKRGWVFCKYSTKGGYFKN